MMKPQAIKIDDTLITRDCDLLASWPGIGNVSLIVAKYMQDKLNARKIGYIEPFDFFDPIGVMVQDNIIEKPQFPENNFYFLPKPESDRDLLIFIGEQQPTGKGYELANMLIDACQHLKVKRVITCAAAIVRLHHTETPRVWAAATSPQSIEDLKQYDVVLKGKIQIAGLNGLFLGVAKEKDMDGICLLGEVPSYTTRIPNPKAAIAILQVLPKILNIEIDLSDLSTVAKQSEDTMKKITSEAMEEYITTYTKPVWPAEEDELDEGIDEEEYEEDEEEEEDEDEEDT
jgi:proteasome assembly chaperone (PAC2) family protein